MSDDSIEYRGLDAAAPLPAEDSPLRPSCSDPECGNAAEHPAEQDWQRFMSAVPVEGQVEWLRPEETGMSYPTGADFRAAVAAVRPEDADAHSLERLRNAWTEQVSGRLADWSDRIRAELPDLAEGWPGGDFEAFEASCDRARDLADDIVDDIDATVASLQRTEEALHAVQGGDSGEIPYPAPQFWIDGEWHSWASVHIRPAWWRGDCIQYTCQDAEHVLALAGAEPELATEIIDDIDERIVHYIDYYSSPAVIERDGLDPAKGFTVEEAKELAVDDAVKHYGALVERAQRAYASRHAEIDGDIAQRGDDTDGEVRSVRTVRSDKDPAADSGYSDPEAPALLQPKGTAAPRVGDEPSLARPADPDSEEPPGGPAAPLAAPVAVGVVQALADSQAREAEPGLVEDQDTWGFVDEDDDPYA